VVLLAALSSGRSEQACADEPALEGAPHEKRRGSAGEQQRHNECVGLAATCIGGNLAARGERLALAGVTRSPG
jgi:hypothetical protein